MWKVMYLQLGGIIQYTTVGGSFDEKQRVKNKVSRSPINKIGEFYQTNNVQF